MPDATSVEGRNVVEFARKSATRKVAVVMLLVGDRTERPSVANTYLPGPQLGSSSGKYTVTPCAMEEVILLNVD